MPQIPNPIPRELRDLPQWIKWKLVDGQKIPIGKVNDPNIWTTFEAVEKCPKKGFVFSEHDPFCGIDLDGCIVDGVNRN